jgi:hypothetical protein
MCVVYPRVCSWRRLPPYDLINNPGKDEMIVTQDLGTCLNKPLNTFTRISSIHGEDLKFIAILKNRAPHVLGSNSWAKTLRALKIGRYMTTPDTSINKRQDHSRGKIKIELEMQSIYVNYL